MNKLTELAKKYKTDKAINHSYTETFYYDLLKDSRDREIKLLELGIGNTGASAKMWREFLPNAKIVTFDPFFLHGSVITVTQKEIEDLGVKVVVGNQLNRDDLRQLSSFGEFDIIIDDASHISDGVQISFAILFPLLREGGVYVVEDLHCAKDRDRRLEQCNAFLDDPKNVRQDIEKFYHRKEVHISTSLQQYSNTGKWNSLLMTEDEKQYVVNNIQSFKFFENGKLVAIQKKERGK